jgi:hypothetical protein
VCVARLPRCWECQVITYCDYQPKTPPPGASVARTNRETAPNGP